MSKIVILRLLDTYFRHRWLYLIPIVLMAVAGGIYIYSQQNLYMTSGIIFAEKSSLLSSLTAVDQQGFSWRTPAQETAGQISDLVRTDAFIRAVIQQTELEPQMSEGSAAAKDLIRQIRKSLLVFAVGNNEVQIYASYDNPRVAYQLARAMINTFILWNINLDRTDSATAEVFFQDLIQGYQANVVTAQDALRSYLETHPKPANGERPDTETFEIQTLQANLDSANARLAHASEKAEDARLAGVQIEGNIRQKYTVVDAPDIPSRSSTSKRKMAQAAAMFLATGVLLSGIAVVGVTVSDQSLRTPVEASEVLGLPILAILPDVSASSPKRAREPKKKDPLKDMQFEPTLDNPEETPSLPPPQEGPSTSQEDSKPED